MKKAKEFIKKHKYDIGYAVGMALIAGGIGYTMVHEHNLLKKNCTGAIYKDRNTRAEYMTLYKEVASRDVTKIDKMNRVIGASYDYLMGDGSIVDKLTDYHKEFPDDTFNILLEATHK